MSNLPSWWTLTVLAGLVGLLLVSGRPSWQGVFQWLPIPLWCYGLPMVLRTLGWLPAASPAYIWTTTWLLPIALGLLLFGVDLAAVWRLSAQALIAMMVGALAIILGGPVMLWALHRHLPSDAWQGIGILAATWTGGSLNMLAVQAILNTPQAVFAPLIVVDALIAYSWMACLVAVKGYETRINRWLRATGCGAQRVSPLGDTPYQGASATHPAPPGKPGAPWCAGALAVGLAAVCGWMAQSLPTGGLVASTTGWTVLLVTSLALLGSCVPSIRRLGSHSSACGYPCLYVVLAVLGAQASLTTLLATPGWIALGVGWLAIHAMCLLVAGRLLRLPLGMLTTASQANIGGVVSAPLVGAVYHQQLAAVGLVLAIGGNAVGTYLGLASATLARWLVPG